MEVYVRTPGGGGLFLLDLRFIKRLNLETSARSLIDEILYLYVHIKNSNLFNIKFKNIPQYRQHALILHLLEYSRIKMPKVH